MCLFLNVNVLYVYTYDYIDRQIDKYIHTYVRKYMRTYIYAYIHVEKQWTSSILYDCIPFVYIIQDLRLAVTRIYVKMLSENTRRVSRET